MWIPRVLIVLVVVAGAVAGVSAELSDEYSIDIDGSMDIPDQTVETDFGEATISEVGKEEAGNSLGVSVDAPENETYRVQIIERDGNRNLLLESKRIEGGDTDTQFDLEPGNSLDEPGTYIVTTVPTENQEAKAIEPFIVKGYSVDQQVSDVTKGTNISVKIELSEVNDQTDPPQAVNVSLTGNGESRTILAEEINGLQYRATFETDSLPTGEYQIYSGVENGDSIYGYDELIGLSSSQTVEIQSQSTDTPVATETPVSTPTTTSVTTEREDSEEEASGDEFGANESPTSTTSAAEPETTEQTASTEQASDDATDDGTVSSTRAGGQDSVTPTQSQSRSPAQTEVVDTTATGTPVMPNLAGLLLIFTLLLFAHRLRR